MDIKYVYPTVLKNDGDKEKVPFGEGHLFLVTNGEVEAESLCKKGRWEIGRGSVTERSTVIQSLPVCPQCAAAWKNHPQSPWAKWAQQIKEIFQNETNNPAS